jgi:hypothetical protein
MRYPQLLVFESDGRLAKLLEATAGIHRWALRQPRGLEACLRLLRGGGPAIVVIRLERDLEECLALMERTARQFPDTAVVVVIDAAEPVLADLCWDLGAAYVLCPPQPRDRLLDVVAGLMGTARPTSAGR